MEGSKHFSHRHNLMPHNLPEGDKVSCSGCNSSATGTVYVCWQCNFFLHQQCFQVSRSMKHPSHPSHPLTLVPYPTYPSNSFYCNSCSVIGTGFSYTCSECDFDLHVQCAYSISNAIISPQQSHNHFSVPNQTPLSHLSHTSNSFPPYDHSNSFQTQQNPVPNAFATHHSVPNNPYTPNLPTSHHVMPNNTYAPHVVPSLHSQLSSNYNIPQSGTNHQSIPSIPTPTNPTKTGTNPTAPPASPKFSSHDQLARHENDEKVAKRGIMHFSHPHGLCLVNIQVRDDIITTCNACEETLIGSGYTCTEAECDFHLHKSCFFLAQELQHKSHPKHPLRLFPSSPYETGVCTCNACFSDISGFTYHCSVCMYDLHVKCTSLPETMKRDDHDHPLRLMYSCPLKGEEYTFSCDVCHMTVHNDCWTYYCKECDYGAHVNCVNCEESPEEPTDISPLEVQLRLQRMQLQMEMARQSAMLMVQAGQSISNLIG